MESRANIGQNIFYKSDESSRCELDATRPVSYLSIWSNAVVSSNHCSKQALDGRKSLRKTWMIIIE